MNRFFYVVFLLFVSGNLLAKEVAYLSQDRICKVPYTQNAILRQDALFVDDFLTLHSLLRIVEPLSVFEIGTCSGEGTLIMKNAIENGTIYSLDLPPGESSYAIEVPGYMCYLPYVQVIGDSMNLDYSKFHPIEAWFIDGAHEYSYVLHETGEALRSNPKIIIWHDADIEEVFEAIKDGLEEDENYLLFRVMNTRIAFAVSKTSELLEIIND
ncbi:MAG: hypothetical protein JSS09_04215 [Verrucomicrobia bacterium]|nr:hypothetical protein [Verrucomicrobiota bacterium]